MELRGRKVLDWRFSIVETAGFAFSLTSLAVAITVWSLTTFQSKAEAIEASSQTERRIEKIDIEMNEVRNALYRIQSQTAFIAGRMGFKEPSKED